MTPQRFSVEFPETRLQDLWRRVQATRFPHDYANDDWSYGTHGDTLRKLVDHWLHGYNWAAQL